VSDRYDDSLVSEGQSEPGSNGLVFMHERWLVGIYDWAGRYRSVNMQKDGFPFAAASRIEPF
jgi:cell filamentation protein